MSILDRALRVGEGKKFKDFEKKVELINAFEPELELESDDELRDRYAALRERHLNGEPLDELLYESFALTREAGKRALGQRHFDVQMIGGMVLHDGSIAEMKTGEGKTLTATLPVVLNGLASRDENGHAVRGQGVHLVTVNDYLARRDALWMKPIYDLLGVTVGILQSGQNEIDKQEAYSRDVVYGTNSEFGFDYLRDNLADSIEAKAQRGHVFAIIDEVDSILIDEARTPLIISGPAEESARLYAQFAAIARGLTRDAHYEVDEEKRTVAPTEEGIERVESALGVNNMYDAVSVNYVHQLTQALRAKELYKRDKDYVVMDGEVKIVDEFTGRIMEGRRWSDGLHQAVEAKENVRVKDEDHTWATVTLQNYFRMYEKLAGMTGTAETEASEFANTYGLAVVPIPTNKPMIRDDNPDLIYAHEMAKFTAAVEDIVERHDRGQPVLVGTASVEKSEVLSRMLGQRGIKHEVLNAKQHFREAEIVAQAGRLHAVTVATNMAGRGVDILLGGNPEGLAKRDVLAEGLDPESEEGKARMKELLPRHEAACKADGQKVMELGGLFVLGSERHESRRIDNQLRGRSGRQGEPGESRFYLSMEDELIRIFATGAVQWLMSKALPDDEPIDMKMISKAVERAQNTVEQRNAEIRKDVLKYDEVLNEQRKVIYARRMQVLDGENLREQTLEVLTDAMEEAVDEYCQTDYPEDWDLDGLLKAVATYYPTKFALAELQQASTKEQLVESFIAEGTSYYEAREQEVAQNFGNEDVMREVEREVMLQIIDARWREHLSEMDYLRDGINLRAMGQKDPLVEWQTDGFEMFGQMMGAINNDYLRYVMHVDVAPEQIAQPEVQLDQASFAGEDAAPQGAAALSAAAVGFDAGEAFAATAAQSAGDGVRAEDIPQQVQQVVRSDAEKTGRNDPCWCGSGKKFKHCHGS